MWKLYLLISQLDRFRNNTVLPLLSITQNEPVNTNIIQKIPEEKLQHLQVADIITSFLYHIAMRDEKIPVKPLPNPEQRLFERFKKKAGLK